LEKSFIRIAGMIKAYRIRSGLTQAELAERAGYDSPVFISLIERKKSKVPLTTLGKLIQILDMPEKEIKKILVDSYHDEIQSEIRVGMKNRA
jgi:transcriptional regulator with XRE-family HTH domain